MPPRSTSTKASGESTARSSASTSGPKQGRQYFGYLSYTLSRSERKDGPNEPWRLFDFDQTHILTAAFVYNFPRNWEIGGTFRLVSGNPYTPVIGSIYDALNDVYIPIDGRVNSLRNPLFNQLDIRIQKKWIFEALAARGLPRHPQRVQLPEPGRHHLQLRLQPAVTAARLADHPRRSAYEESFDEGRAYARCMLCVVARLACRRNVPAGFRGDATSASLPFQGRGGESDPAPREPESRPTRLEVSISCPSIAARNIPSPSLR